MKTISSEQCVVRSSSGGRATSRSARGRMRVRAAAAGAAIALALAPLQAAADDNSSADLARDAGLGAGAAVASLVYAPVKLVYATGGLIVGGLAWAFSGGDTEVAKVVFTPSLRGDYVVTKQHLNGTDRFEFFGRKGEGMESRDVAAAPTEWSSDW